ncbi:hypothetical protein BC567DRAFT_299635 [Phyllosticta citribraziliensis]
MSTPMGRAFVRHYYKLAALEPDRLARCYAPAAHRTYCETGEEPVACSGREAIATQLSNFQGHLVCLGHVDVQLAADARVFVLTTGFVHGRKFVQTLLLAPVRGKLLIANDIFRFIGDRYNGVLSGGDGEQMDDVEHDNDASSHTVGRSRSPSPI